MDTASEGTSIWESNWQAQWSRQCNWINTIMVGGLLTRRFNLAFSRVSDDGHPKPISSQVIPCRQLAAIMLMSRPADPGIITELGPAATRLMAYGYRGSSWDASTPAFSAKTSQRSTEFEWDMLNRPEPSVPLSYERIGQPTQLKAHMAGQLYVRRSGLYVDICIGNTPEGELRLAYRFSVTDFLGRKRRVEIETMSELPGQDCTVSLADVKIGQQIARIDRGVLFHQCLAPGNEVRRVLPPGVPDASSPYFATVMRMLDIQLPRNDQRKITEQDVLQRMPGPTVLVEYSQKALDSIVYQSGFGAQKAMVDDVLKSLSPDGLRRPCDTKSWHLEIRSQFSGTIQAIDAQPDGYLVTIANNKQFVPDTTQFSVAVGQDVVVGRPLGAPLPYGDYTLDDLNHLPVKSRRVIYDMFLHQVAVSTLGPYSSKPNWLVPINYLPHIPGLAEPLAEDRNAVSWWLDVSQIMCYYDHVSCSIIMPSAMYTAWEDVNIQWGDCTFTLPGVTAAQVANCRKLRERLPKPARTRRRRFTANRG